MPHGIGYLQGVHRRGKEKKELCECVLVGGKKAVLHADVWMIINECMVSSIVTAPPPPSPPAHNVHKEMRFSQSYQYVWFLAIAITSTILIQFQS